MEKPVNRRNLGRKADMMNKYPRLFTTRTLSVQGEDFPPSFIT